MLIPLLGIGNPTAVVALTLYGIMPMVRNTYAGITGVSSDIVSAAEAMGSTRAQIMLKIKLPLAMGVIVAGVRNMVVMTISVAAIASFIGGRRAWRRNLQRDHDLRYCNDIFRKLSDRAYRDRK